MSEKGTILMRDSRGFSVGQTLFMAGCDLDMAAMMMAFEHRSEKSMRQFQMERDLNVGPDVVRTVRSTVAQPAV